MKKILNSRLKRNAIFSGGQALISIASMFWAYRVLLQEVGIERLGLWSLMIASASIARAADLTGAGGLSRFVAEAKSDRRDAASYVHTVVLSTLALYTALLLIFLASGEYALIRFIDPQLLDEAKSLLPLALIVGLLMTPLSSTLTSGIDGVGRADQRAILVIISNLLFLGAVLIFVPYFGVWAWGYAIVFQQAFKIFGAWAILTKHITGLGFLPTKWSNKVLRETVAYGLKIQANSIAMMLSDPVVKFILNSYAGLEAVGLYDLGAKLVEALRSVVVQMATPLVPEFASLRMDGNRIRILLRKSLQSVATYAMVMLVSLVPIAPSYSVIMFGEINLELLMIIAALSTGYAVNIIAIPYYFAGVGLNYMRWNIGAHILMAASILTIGIPLGAKFGSGGILVAIFLGTVGGAVMVVFGNGQFLRRRE
ncbi:lipopolysaccharide biosynthesis protein [Falsihalocynthiibacter sp. BN13B15]|uniref:lipopolysaccharide biosynthesis protein n=1 Tax=Falsihalocynthiibacter sp. BN13B15 TaxID=3240871 RepID=UPI00350E8F69